MSKTSHRSKLKNTTVGFFKDVLRNKYSATSIIAIVWVMFISDVDLFYIIDEQIVSRPTLRLLEGIHEIGKILYPDVFDTNRAKF